MITKLEIFLF